MTMRAVDANYKAKAGEVLSDDLMTAEKLGNAFPIYTAALARENIFQQIYTLEASITTRRAREAILGHDNGWMAGIEANIEALRAQLT